MLNMNVDRLKVCAAVAAAGVALVSSARADGLAVSYGGGLDFTAAAGMRFSPQLFDAGWSVCKSTGGWDAAPGVANGRRFSIVDGAQKPVADGLLEFAPADGGGVALKWSFTALRDFEGKTFCIGLEIPCAECRGTDGKPASIAFGGREIVFPETYGKTSLGGATGAKATLRLRGQTLGFEADEPIGFYVQDNRAWRSETFSVRLSLGDGRLKSGEKRRLAFRLRGVEGAADGACQIEADAGWVPVVDTTAIAAGSALDFSALGWIDAPAGKHGRVVAKGSRFEFEGRPGVAQRFYGVNLCFDANYMSAETAEELCTRLSRMGYNALRIHHYESNLCDRKDGTAILPDKMAELDNLLDACIRHGIYLTTDLFVSRNIPWRSCGFDRDGNIPMSEFKELVIFNEGAFRNYLDFARAFLNHVNPKTSRRWADEPALAFLALVNEGNLGNHGYDFVNRIPEARAAWKEWLAARKAAEPETYRDVTEKIPANAWENSVQNCALCLFLAEREAAFAEKMRRFLRDEIKTSVLITDMSCWKNPVCYQLVRTRYDYVDDHFYVDHPQFLGQSWRLPSKCPNANPVKSPNAGFEGVFKHRLLDKPFTITEFNYSGPGRFRGVGGMLLGAQAALQEYDGIWRFAWSHNADALLKPAAMGYFDVARDPLQRATERAVLTLYMRRDLKPLERTFAIVLPEKAVRTDFTCGPQADIKDMWYGWYSKLGTWVGDAKPAWATHAGLFPSVYTSGSETFKDLARGKEPGDGQVSFDREAGTFRVITPKTQGFFAEDGEVTAGALTARVGGAPAAVWVSSLDGAPVETSKRLLLTHVTDVQDEGTRYADAKKTILTRWGHLPHLMRCGRADIRLALRSADRVRVWALNADGTRREEVRTDRKGGAIAFTADTARDPKNATCFYEIGVE